MKLRKLFLFPIILFSLNANSFVAKRVLHLPEGTEVRNFTTPLFIIKSEYIFIIDLAEIKINHKSIKMESIIRDSLITNQIDSIRYSGSLSNTHFNLNMILMESILEKWIFKELKRKKCVVFSIATNFYLRKLTVTKERLEKLIYSNYQDLEGNLVFKSLKKDHYKGEMW
jgi:hypothetical protein